MTAFSCQPAQHDSTAEKPAMTRPARRAPAPRYPRITTPSYPIRTPDAKRAGFEVRKRTPGAKRAESRPYLSLRVGCGRETRRALGEESARVEHTIAAKLAFGYHRDAGLEDVRQSSRVVDRHRRGAVLFGEGHMQPAIAFLNVVLDDPRHAHVSGARVRAQLTHREVVLGGASRGVDQIAHAPRHDKRRQDPLHVETSAR